MTREEAIRKMEFCKNAYQKLIDEEVDNGTFVGTGVNGVWKADTPLTKAYSDMVDACDMAIKALEQEPCEDAISRKRLKECFHKNIVNGEFFDEIIDMQPLVQPKVKTGHWRAVYQGDEIIDYRCSECEFGNTFGKGTYRMNYCPNCGAKMVEPQESEG